MAGHFSLHTIKNPDAVLNRSKCSKGDGGLKVATYPKPEKLGKQFKYADRIKARVAVVLGPDEQADGLVLIKNLQTRTQEAVPREDAANAIQKMLDSEAAS